MTPMDDTRLDELEALEKAASAGPWRDLTATYRECMHAYHKRTGKWWHGTRENSTPVVLIVTDSHHGEPINIDRLSIDPDYWDMHKVLSLRWSAFPKRVKEIDEGFLMPADAALMCAARNALPELISELRRVRAELSDARLIQQLIRRGLAPLYEQFDSSGKILGWEFYDRGFRKTLLPDEATGLPQLTPAARAALGGEEKQV